MGLNKVWISVQQGWGAVAEANDGKSTDSGKPRVHAGDKKRPVWLRWGKCELQLER